MANRRTIKKGINYLMGDVIEECYSEILNNPDKNEAKINVIIDEAVDVADDLIARVNQSDKVKGKELKVHFNNIEKDLKEASATLIEKLNKVS